MTLVGKGLGKLVALSSDNIVSRPPNHINDYLQMALLSYLPHVASPADLTLPLTASPPK